MTANFTANNPSPTLASITPNSTTTGSTGFNLSLAGTGFIASSSVLWNGSARATTFVSANELQATIQAADIASLGSAAVTVDNPGGVAAVLTLTVAIVAPLTDLSAVRVFPNPWRSDQGVPVITFDHLTTGSTVKIFDLAGHWVKTLTPDSISGTWDLTNDSGKMAASGLYFYVITDPSGSKARGKLTIIK